MGSPEKKSIPLFAVQDFLKNQQMFETIPLSQIAQYTSKHAPSIDTDNKFLSVKSSPVRSKSPISSLPVTRPVTTKALRLRCRKGEEKYGVV